MVPYHGLTDGLRTANDPRFLGLLEQGCRSECVIGKVAFRGRMAVLLGNEG
jgi:hypothetical protein